MKYEKVAVGGTFDILHDGHKAILSKAFEIGEHVLVGIANEEMRLLKDAAGIQKLEGRKEGLKNFLEEKGWLERAEIEEISDPIGPAGRDEEIEAIVVSEETRSGAENVNEVRAEADLPELDVVVVPLVIADDGKPISSVRIRYKEIDARGNVLDSD